MLLVCCTRPETSVHQQFSDHCTLVCLIPISLTASQYGGNANQVDIRKIKSLKRKTIQPICSSLGKDFNDRLYFHLIILKFEGGGGGVFKYIVFLFIFFIFKRMIQVFNETAYT